MRSLYALLTGIGLFLAFAYGDFICSVYEGDVRRSSTTAGQHMSAMPQDWQAMAKASAPTTTYGLVRRVDVGEQKVVALTFDFCELATSSTGYNAPLVRFLQRNKIPATLFIGGKWLRTHARRGQELLAWPLFEIANHAWSHANFAIIDGKSMEQQVQWMQAQYEALAAENHTSAGEDFQPQHLSLFRFPYGRSSPQALRFLQEKGITPIQWDVVGEIFADNAVPHAAETLFEKVRPGSILLFHGNTVPKNTEVLVPRLVKLLRQAGYEFVSVGKLLTMGTPEVVEDGYFSQPGDNHSLDTRFGPQGTGRLP